MDNLAKEIDEIKLPILEIKEDYERYKKGKRVLAKLAEANEFLEKHPLPAAFYWGKRVLYSDVVLADEAALAQASEPSVEYGKPKKEAED